MITRYRVRIGTNWLDAIDKRIAILDISNPAPAKQRNKQRVAGLDGVDIVDTYVEGQTVTVTFELHIYDPEERTAICRKINNWADSGTTLRTSERGTSLYLKAICEQYASVNARDWTAPVSLVFSTVDVPYWQSLNQTTKTITGVNVSSKLDLDGDVWNPFVSATVTPTKGTISSLKLVVGSTNLELTGISVLKDEKIVVDYVDGRYLRIRQLTTADKVKASLLGNLKATSSDNLRAPSGKASTISVTANKQVKAVFTARGCWL